MTKPLVMIIEDDVSLTTVFTHMLHKANYETEVILDGQEALDRLASVTPHLILLDINLPSVSGTDILTHIRNENRFDETKVILATANPHIAKHVENLADLVLIKPVGIKQLFKLACRLHPDNVT